MARPTQSQQHPNLQTAITEVARKQIAEHGAASLSLRAIARELGITAPAIYNYYPSRDNLVTSLIVNAYHSFATALAKARDAEHGDHTECIMVTARAYRNWALAHPEDKDGMASALESYNTADLVIFGTPLYHFGMSGIMKTFIDRTLPRIEPWLIPHPDIPDTTFHPERFHKPEKMLLVSPCGFPEYWHFDSLVVTFKQIARMERFEYLGEILRPGAEPLSDSSLQGLFTEYYETLHQAGAQIIANGSILEETQANLQKDLFPGGKQAFYSMANAYWEQRMDKFNVPEEKRHSVPGNTILSE